MTIGGECGPPSKINSHDFLNAWNKNLSYTELHKKFNCSKTTIQNYLNKYQVNTNERRIRAVAYKSKAVDRYSLMGQFIKTYPSVSEAARELSINYPKCHTSMICAACLKKITSAYNSLWKYHNDDTTTVKELVENAKNKKHHRNRAVN